MRIEFKTETFGEVPELLVSLSTGHRIRTTVMVTGEPEWSIRLAENEYLGVIDGEIQKDDGTSQCSQEETLASYYAEKQVAKRWATPTIEPAIGSCFQCSSFVRLNGHSSLLDYGVCTARLAPGW